MKRSELFFSFLLVPVDFAMILGAALAVYFVRYSHWATALRPVVFNITLGDYLRVVIAAALIWLPIFALAQLYTIRATVRLTQEFGRVVLGCSTGLVAIVLIIFFRHELFGSRFLVLAGYLVSIIFVFLGRVIIRRIQRSLLKKQIGVWRVVLIGNTNATYALERSIEADPASGYKIVRRFKNLDQSSFGMLLNLAKEQNADMIIHTDSSHSRADIGRLWQFCQEYHLEFAYIADMFEAKTSNIEMLTLGGLPVIQIKRTALDGWGRIVKRTLDIFGSLAALVFILPLSAAVGLIIKLNNPGPVFVKLTRVGEGGERFKLYKFRSMIVGAHDIKQQLLPFNERAGGPLFKMHNDPRITKAGKFLRAWSLDELPNFMNVLKGEMSLVGPRPHEPEEVGHYTPNQKRLLTIKPGVTGLAQISGRSDLDFAEEERLDIFYIENWSFWLDLQILLRTPFVVLSRKNVA